MSTIKAALRAALLGDATLQGYVGDRVYTQFPEVEPVYPLITYALVGGSAVNTDGAPAINQPRYEVRVFGEEVDPIASRIIAVLGAGRWPCRLVSEIELDGGPHLNIKALDFRFTGPF